MIAGLLDSADAVSAWPASFAGPALMPVRLTVCAAASSFSVTGLGAFTVGASLIGLIVTAKVRVMMLLAPAPSLTVTVIVAGPPAAVLALAVVVKVSVPVEFGLV